MGLYFIFSFYSHKVFGGHFLCVFENFQKVNTNDFGIKEDIRNVNYSQPNTALYFYNWEEKVKY